LRDPLDHTTSGGDSPPSLYIYIYGGVISDRGWGPEKRSQGEEDLVSRELSEVMWPLAVTRLLIPGFRHAHTLQLLKSLFGHSPPGECLEKIYVTNYQLK